MFVSWKCLFVWLLSFYKINKDIYLEVNLKSRPFLSQMKPFPDVQIFLGLMQKLSVSLSSIGTFSLGLSWSVSVHLCPSPSVYWSVLVYLGPSWSNRHYHSFSRLDVAKKLYEAEISVEAIKRFRGNKSLSRPCSKSRELSPLLRIIDVSIIKVHPSVYDL